MKAKLVDGILYTIDEEQKIEEINKMYDLEIIQNNISDEIINAILKKPEKERTVEELMKIVRRKEVNDNLKTQLAEVNSYLPIVEEKYNGDALLEHQSLYPVFKEQDGKIIKSFAVKNDIFKVRQEIESLKKKLSDSDYMIIKMYESKILFEDSPYDESIIHERRNIRDKINQLEDLIKTFKS